MSEPTCYKCGTADNVRGLKHARHPDRTHVCDQCALDNIETGLNMKLQRVGDGCEWNPGADRPARAGDAHNSTTPAALLVGADGNWRLCALCAALPRFRRFRRRKPIEQKPDVL